PARAELLPRAARLPQSRIGTAVPALELGRFGDMVRLLRWRHAALPGWQIESARPAARGPAALSRTGRDLLRERRDEVPREARRGGRRGVRRRAGAARNV